EDDVVQILREHSRLAQAIGHGVRWKPRVVLFARKPLLLGGGEDITVADEGSRAVMIERGNPKDGSQRLPLLEEDAARPALGCVLAWEKLKRGLPFHPCRGPATERFWLVVRQASIDG